MEFKDRLIFAMQQKNITPAELSRITGIGEGAISQYRKGAYKATQKNLSSIAYALGVSIPWLMGIDDNEIATVYDKRIFADNLLRLMADIGETQADIARLLGVSKSTVSAYCKATQIPRLDKIEILATHFGVRTAELIEDSSFPAVPSPAPHDAIGHRIRAARESQSMTQEELAQKMGYRSKSTINKIEKGINDIPRAKVAEFAHVLGVSAVSLMGLDPAPAVPSPAPPDTMTLGEVVTKYRNEHNLSQRQFAAMCGLSNGYISMLEKNENPGTGQPITPTIPVLQKLADGMDISVSSLCCTIGLPLFDMEAPAPHDAIGHRIRAARESHGMTQEELGRLCHTTKQTIFKYESGIVTNIPHDRVEQIAAALHVSPAYLLGIEATPDTDPALSRLAAQLNAAGRDKLIAYADDLIATGRYAKEAD